MGKLVYTVTTAGAAAGAISTTTGNPNSASVQGCQPWNQGLTGLLVNTIVPDTHPMIEKWLAAGYVTQISL